MSSQTAGGGTPALNRIEVAVQYEDGTGDTVILKPVALVAAERHFKGNMPGVEGTLWAAHYLLTREGTVTDSFADWLERLVVVEERPANPTSAPTVEL